MSLRVMGIDAGFQAMGLVVVEGNRIMHAESFKTERTAKKRSIRVADDDAERCRELVRFLHAVITVHEPYGAAVELPSGGAQGARANRAMGMSTALVVSVLEMHGMPAEWVTPQMVKKATTGRNDGAKEKVQEAVRDRFEWGNHWPKHKWAQEHVADAAAAVVAAEGGTLMRMVERLEDAG